MILIRIVFGGISFVSSMVKYCGMKAKISEVYKNFGITCYSINLDKPAIFMWIEEMFEDIKVIRKRKLEKLNV